MLLTGNPDGNGGPENFRIHSPQCFLQGVQPPVRLLFRGAVVILVQVQCRALTGHNFPSGEIIKKDFEGLGAQIDANHGFHGFSAVFN